MPGDTLGASTASTIDMAPPLLEPPQRVTVEAEPLTPSNFSPFGIVITSPLPAPQSSIPKDLSLPRSLYPSHQPAPIIANQSTALKYSPISPLVNCYQVDAPHRGPANALMSMFCCFPQLGSSAEEEKQQQQQQQHQKSSGTQIAIPILERHPFTSQTFTPIGLVANDPNTCFLVVVAPSLSHSLSAASLDQGRPIDISDPPDLANVRAFVGHGGQAVTYGIGIWHAPMRVLGRRRVDFVVTQFASGVAEEDCQEVRVGNGIGVRVHRARQGDSRL